MDTIDFVKTDCNDLSCHTGVTFYASLAVINRCTEQIADLSGYTASLVIFGSDEADEIDEIPGIVDVAKGIITFTISAVDTEDYEIGIYNYQINVSQLSSVFRLAQGKFEVSA